MEVSVEFVTKELGIKLKEKQLEAILAFMSGRDVFVSLPTGYGKSFIYALLPLTYNHYKKQQGSIVVCVSPLTSLMMDQKKKFSPQGISTDFVGEDQTDKTSISNILKGNIQLVYISPESLVCNPMYRNMLLSPVYKEKLVALVIDEAHCVKTWGDKFRTAFAHLGEIRSIIPSTVNVLSLTATATNETYNAVCKRLSLCNPILVGCSPHRKNIFYTVKSLPTVQEFCIDVAKDVKLHGPNFPKTIIFCRRYSDCAALYHTFRSQLGEYFTYPKGFPDFQQFRLIDMYTRASKVEMKEKVLSSICDPQGILRVVLATTAFGMGIDCPDIHHIIHWGPPCSLEEYAQESGRAGRDSLPSKACLLYGNPGKFVGAEVKEYAANNESCRRKLLFQNFLFSSSEYDCSGCSCCDICKRSCVCINCAPSIQ